MSSKTKKASKPKKATAAAPKAEEAVEAPEAAKAAPNHLLVRIGPNSEAGRIMLGQTVYDALTPRRMARGDYERLKDRYDLQEVKDS